MKRIVLSKRRDDDILPNWLKSLGIEILPVTTKIDSWVDGIVIGGGLAPYEDPERDDIEFSLVKQAVKENVPLLGICRGCEVLTLGVGGAVKKMNDLETSMHRHKWHKVILSNLWPYDSLDIWSNHGNHITKMGILGPVAYSPDGVIEAVADPKRRLLGVQWHPEKSHQEGYSSVYPWLKWIEKRF